MNLIEILEEYRVPFRRHGEDKNVRHGWIGLHCPCCGRPDDKYYLGWNLEKQFFSCWSCGPLNFTDTLSELIHEPPQKCREIFRSFERPERIADRKTGRLILPENLQPLEWSPAHRKYLRDRGFDPDTLIAEWGLSAIGVAPRLQWRIFIPIIWHGETVSWTTRAIGNVEPRYISATPEEESVHHKKILYGGDKVRHAVIVHEGPADVWATGPGAVALLGLSFTPEQVLWLSRISRRITCFDNEPAAQRRAAQLCDQLAGFAGETQNVVLDAKDAGSADEDELRALRKFLE